MKLHEKISYYRQTSKMTQEDVAETLKVSRQTIAKWESNLATPKLSHAIQLSKLFGITLDQLAKESDCASNVNTTKSNATNVIEFLLKAKKETYAAKKGKVKSSRINSIDLAYKEGEFDYLDTYLGAKCFSGEEGVWYQGMPIWSMNYYGQVLEDSFSGDFLKEALMQVNANAPFRGPNLLKNGEYTYHCNVRGDFDAFQGKEEIYHQERKVYELWFHGGKIN